MSIFRSIKLLVGTAIALSLVACTSPDENKPQAGNGNPDANFLQTKAVTFETAVGINTFAKTDSKNALNKAWDYPTQRTYTFSACLADARTNQSIITEQAFAIEVDSKQMIESTTDRDGCVRWTEKLDFNFFADAKYIKVARKIHGRGSYGGIINVDLLINPWAQRDSGLANPIEVLDLNFNTDKELLNLAIEPKSSEEMQYRLQGGSQNNLGLRAMGSAAAANKEVGLTRLTYQLLPVGVTEPNKFLLEMSVDEFHARVKTPWESNHRVKLRTGIFGIHTRIVDFNETTGEYRMLDKIAGKQQILALNLDPEELAYLKQNSKYKNATIIVRNIDDGQVTVRLPKEMSVNWEAGKAGLVVRIQPLENEYLSEFTGVYLGGQVRGLGLSASSARRIDTDDNFTNDENSRYKVIVNNKHAILNEAPEEGVFEMYRFDNMRPRFQKVLKGETITARTVRYTVSTTVRSNVTFGYPAIGTKFRIDIVHDKTKEKQTKHIKVQQFGQLNWEGDAYHKVYLPEKYELYTVTFTEVNDEVKTHTKSGKKLPSYKVNAFNKKKNISNVEPLGYAINPWGDNLVFSEDKRIINPEQSKKEAGSLLIPSRFIIADFAYDAIRFRYDIDDFLNLNVKKTVLLRMAPKRLNYNSRTTGRYSYYPLRDGIYLLKAGFDKFYLDPTNTGVSIKRGDSSDKFVSSLVNAETGNKLLHAANKVNDAPYLDKKDGSPIQTTDDTVTYTDEKTGEEFNLMQMRQLTIDQKLVRVRAGEIVTPFEFEVDDLRIMRIRTQMVMQLDAVNEQALWLVNIYNDFYTEAIAHIESQMDEDEKLRFRSNTYIELIKEKRKNLLKIARALKGDPKTQTKQEVLEKERILDYFMKNKELYYDLNPKVSYQGKDYDVCPGESRITLSEVLKEFGIKQDKLKTQIESVLENKGAGVAALSKVTCTEQVGFKENPTDFENALKDSKGNVRIDEQGNPILEKCVLAEDSYVEDIYALYKHKEKVEQLATPVNNAELKCLRPENILRKVYLNDPIENKVAPIDGFDLDELVDSTMVAEEDIKKGIDGVPIESFTGPVTFVHMGNRSSMRTTKNLTDKLCPISTDCSELTRKKDFKYAIEELRHYKKVAPLNQYDQNRYYGGIKYLDGLLASDLFKTYEILELNKRRQNEIKTLPYYFLKTMGLQMFSLGERNIHEVSQATAKCPGIFTVVQRKEKTMFGENYKHENELEDCLKVNNTLNLRNTRPEFNELETEIEQQVKKSFTKVKLRRRAKDKSLLFESDKLANAVCEYIFPKSKKSAMSKGLDSYLGLRDQQEEFNKACMKKLQGSFFSPDNVISVERKLRVKKVARNQYYYRGGKNMNLQVGTNFGIGHSTSVGGGGGFSLPFFKLGADAKKSNSQSDGVSVSDGTYLVMQDSKMDIMLDTYIPCLVVNANKQNKNVAKAFSQRAHNKLNFKTKGHYSDLEHKEAMHEMAKGVMFCGKEVDHDLNEPDKKMRIRESYYYFTQHFTEGDMQDTADLFNHPWMLEMRGEVDMWRFVNSFEGAVAQYKPGTLIGTTTGDEATIPIDILLDVYKGVVPTFPGVYSMVNMGFTADYPWQQGPEETFENDINEVSIDKFILKENKEISVDKYTENYAAEPGSEFDKEDKIAAKARKELCPNLKSTYVTKFMDGFGLCTPSPETKVKDCSYGGEAGPLGCKAKRPPSDESGQSIGQNIKWTDFN